MGFLAPLFLLGLAEGPTATAGFVSVFGLWLGGGGMSDAAVVAVGRLHHPSLLTAIQTVT